MGITFWRMERNILKLYNLSFKNMDEYCDDFYEICIGTPKKEDKQ